ncbi:MAG: hypothetical protein AAF433_18570 [Bacteroidota bacterium]
MWGKEKAAYFGYDLAQIQMRANFFCRVLGGTALAISFVNSSLGLLIEGLGIGLFSLKAGGLMIWLTEKLVNQLLVNQIYAHGIYPAK